MMEEAEYKQLVASLEGLTDDQVEAVLAALQRRRDGDGVQRQLQKLAAESQRCPHCDSETIVKFGFSFGSQRFRCKDCRKTFNALTGTPLNRLRGKEKFLENAACMADGLSVRKTAARTGMSVRKAFRWRHKFLGLLNGQKPAGLSGVVEADETSFPVSYKGQKKDLPRLAKKRAGKNKDGSGGEKTKVVVAVQRGTKLEFDQILADATASSLTDALRPALSPDAVLSSDGNAAYWSVADDLGVEAGHFVAAFHGKGGDGVWHVQSVNRYDSSLKTWMKRFRGVATKYLPNYLGWRRLLDRFSDALTPQQFLFRALRPAYQ
jgi:transposase-like protein